MNRTRAFGHRHWLSTLMLVLAALFVRAAVPAGYMPTATERGTVITLCTSQGAIKMVMPASHGAAQHESDKGNGDMPCAFGAVVAAIDLPQITALAAPLWVPIAQITSAAIADLTVHRLAAPPPPSQGPPSLR